MTGYDADASSALTTLAGVFQLLLESHIVWLHTTGNTDKTDLAQSTISPRLHQPETKGACTPSRDRFVLSYKHSSPLTARNEVRHKTLQLERQQQVHRAYT